MGIFQNIANRISEADQAREDIDDDRTKDRYLRSLRRQYRVQQEEKEKELLKKKIKEYEEKRANLLMKANQDKSYLLKKKKEQLGYFKKFNL